MRRLKFCIKYLSGGENECVLGSKLDIAVKFSSDGFPIGMGKVGVILV